MTILRIIVIGLALSLIIESAGAQTAPACISGAQKVFKKGKIPVALVLDSKIPANMVEGNSLAPGMCFKTLSVKSFLTKLGELETEGIPISTLSISSHGATGSGVDPEEGVLFFEQGDETKISLKALAKRIKTKLPNGFTKKPDRISFRGCRIGGSSFKSLDNFRKALGAKSAEATNCFTVPQQLGTIHMQLKPGGPEVAIRDQKQLKDEKTLNEFKDALNDEINESFQSFNDFFGNTRHAKTCIVRPKGFTKTKRKTGIDDEFLLYFLNRGDLVSVWTNPVRGTQWDRDSVCFNKLKKIKGGKKLSSRCRLVEVP